MFHHPRGVGVLSRKVTLSYIGCHSLLHELHFYNWLCVRVLVTVQLATACAIEIAYHVQMLARAVNNVKTLTMFGKTVMMMKMNDCSIVSFLFIKIIL